MKMENEKHRLKESKAYPTVSMCFKLMCETSVIILSHPRFIHGHLNWIFDITE
jgi:hypothetical protein